jgi:hypothetical protein
MLKSTMATHLCFGLIQSGSRCHHKLKCDKELCAQHMKNINNPSKLISPELMITERAEIERVKSTTRPVRRREQRRWVPAPSSLAHVEDGYSSEDEVEPDLFGIALETVNGDRIYLTPAGFRHHILASNQSSSSGASLQASSSSSAPVQASSSSSGASLQASSSSSAPVQASSSSSAPVQASVRRPLLDDRYPIMCTTEQITNLIEEYMLQDPNEAKMVGDRIVKRELIRKCNIYETQVADFERSLKNAKTELSRVKNSLVAFEMMSTEKKEITIEECPICTCSGKGLARRCGHVICNDCTSRLTSNSCPMCRETPYKLTNSGSVIGMSESGFNSTIDQILRKPFDEDRIHRIAKRQGFRLTDDTIGMLRLQFED